MEPRCPLDDIPAMPLVAVDEVFVMLLAADDEPGTMEEDVNNLLEEVDDALEGVPLSWGSCVE